MTISEEKVKPYRPIPNIPPTYPTTLPPLHLPYPPTNQPPPLPTPPSLIPSNQPTPPPPSSSTRRLALKVIRAADLGFFSKSDSSLVEMLCNYWGDRQTYPARLTKQKGRQGKARQGKARQGKARQGRQADQEKDKVFQALNKSTLIPVWGRFVHISSDNTTNSSYTSLSRGGGSPLTIRRNRISSHSERRPQQISRRASYPRGGNIEGGGVTARRSVIREDGYNGDLKKPIKMTRRKRRRRKKMAERRVIRRGGGGGGK
ncbi:pre-mRNA 3'-end-processing factor FIP1-like [Macrobrachium nipponense]|uniref:pre-mRNA 3'-end-processing factor FIP1-like n=1 Tax=Macrobrachium nipponense TaxID=159736 RepID=UPI0030C8C2E1